MNKKLIVAIYGGYQLNLKEVGILDEKGYPIEAGNLTDEDAVAIYRYFASHLKSIHKKKLHEYAKEYNKQVNKLHNEYHLNNFMLIVKFSEKYLEEFGTHVEKIMILPKISRLLSFIVTKVTKEVAIESTQAGDNLYRMMTGRLELTKEVREANTERWKRK